MGQDLTTIMIRLMPLNEKIKKIIENKNKSPLYLKEIVNDIVFVFLSTQFYFFILGFDSLISCLVYICEESEKNLFPKIILLIFEDLIDKKFLDYLSKYKDYPQNKKEEIIKATFEEKEIEYYTENPIGKEEIKKIVNNIDNQDSNLIFFYEKIFKIGFSILFPIFDNKSIQNKIKTYEQFIQILTEEIEKLNNKEKKIVLESFLQVNELKYTNFVQQMIIYCILLIIKAKSNNEEKFNLIRITNFYKLVEILQKITNGENELKSLFNFNTKEMNISDIFNINDINIYIFHKKIIEFNNKSLHSLNYYEIIKQKEKTNFITTYICQDFLLKEELSLIKINIKGIKQDKELFTKFKKLVTKEIELRNYMYELNESSLKLYNYIFSEKYFIMVNEIYDCTLKDLLLIRKKLSLIEIKNIFRQINIFLHILIINNITNIGLRPEYILLKYKDRDKNKYQIKLYFYYLSYELSNLINDDENNNIIFMAPELIKKENNNNKSELFTLGVILYFLFMEKYPFGNNSNEILSKIENNLNDFFLDENIDFYFKDLLNKLLIFEPNKRISWDDYFKHEFFRIKFDEKGKIV